jgi:RNA polymerase sigma-70 factor (subfamily 1)
MPLRPARRSAITPATITPSDRRWEDLLRQARSGSRDAQADLLAAVRPYLLATANREVASDLRTKLAASDVVQNATWRAACAFADFRGRTRAELLGWLRTMVRNCVADGVRSYRQTDKRKLERERSLQRFERGSLKELADPGDSPSGCVIADERHEILERALRQLAPRQEQVVRFRVELDLSFGEIGELLDCTENAARKVWLVAIKRLGRELHRHGRSEI